MDAGEARLAARRLGLDPDSVPIVRLPARSRRVNRLIERLEPLRSGGILAWIICEPLGCYLCISREPYRVERGLREEYDRLSGLRHRIPWAAGSTGSGYAWRLAWKGDIYEVEWLGCGAKVAGGRVECMDEEVCRRWHLS